MEYLLWIMGATAVTAASSSFFASRPGSVRRIVVVVVFAALQIGASLGFAASTADGLDSSSIPLADSASDLPRITMVGPSATEVGWIMEVGAGEERSKAILDAFATRLTFETRDELEEYIRQQQNR